MDRRLAAETGLRMHAPGSRGKIVPVLLSGGSGMRLWPLSRLCYPKQLHPLTGEHSLLQEAALRTVDATRFEPPIVVANAAHRFMIAEQLHAVGFEGARIVLEPSGRNTAPAAAAAALIAIEADEDATLLISPADHVIRDRAAFLESVQTGLGLVGRGLFALFGLKPDRAATGYGYIARGAPIDGVPGANRIAAFVEKPDSATAETYLATGNHLWNSGIFLLSARRLIEELERYQPEVVDCMRRAVSKARADLDFTRLDASAFDSSPAISLDHAVMERTESAAVIAVDAIGWTDVGAWSALWDTGDKDESGNVAIGDAHVHNSSGCYLRSDGPLVAAVGVRDLVVVATLDAVLIADRSADQDVKAMVEHLIDAGREAATQSPVVHRPWGFYQFLHGGERFQVKRITVKPGGKLSLQKHFHRAEHWVVVNGTALVTRDSEQILLRENESAFLPLGCVHRLENPGRLPLNLIEVQSGAYLGEDDIVRLDDVYARQDEA